MVGGVAGGEAGVREALMLRVTLGVRDDRALCDAERELPLALHDFDLQPPFPLDFPPCTAGFAGSVCILLSVIVLLAFNELPTSKLNLR